MAVVKIETSVREGSQKVAQIEEITAEIVLKYDLAVANGQTDQQNAMTIDVSQMRFIYLLSDQTVTLETNSGSAPDATVSLVANSPMKWTVGGSGSNPFGATDVTALFITNASGSTANIDIWIGIDPTV